MKKCQFNIILLLLSFWSYNAHSQTNCTVPLPPVFTSVSVQTETGITEFKWDPSPSSDIAAYVIYSYKDNIGMPIDTLWDPSATSYSYSTTATKYFSVSYVVAAHRKPDCTSPLSNALTTIFAAADIDTCNKKIVVAWNSYSSVPKKVKGYTILSSVNGAGYTESATLGSGVNLYTLNDFTTDAQYCFVVRANLEDGTYSTSNKTCLSTKMQRPPQWINADQATVNPENGIILSFTIDPASEISRFRLEKKSGAPYSFQEIVQISSLNNSVKYTDKQADVNIINYYRLSAINNCSIPVTVSNYSSNIVLSLERKDNDLNLTWNSYKDWLGEISEYRLFLNTGKGFEEKAVLSSPDTVYTLRYKEIMYEVSGQEVCFYIAASETSNPYGITGQSLSSGVCTTPTEIISVPNIFTPNNDLVNDLFKPVLSFTPVDYHLVISDRQGIIVFETRDYNAAWDGSQNGNPHPQGVCLWFLKVTTPSGNIISKSGTLTIINSR